MKKNWMMKTLAIIALVVSVVMIFSGKIYFKIDNLFFDLTLERILLLVVSLVLVISVFGKK